MFEATQNPIDPHLILDSLKRDTHGALVSFIGTARGYSADGKRVLFVEFEGDKEEVEQKLQEVEEEVDALVRDAVEYAEKSPWPKPEEASPSLVFSEPIY